MAHPLQTPASPVAVARRSNRPDLASDAIRTAREDLAACFRMAARNGFEEGICNHFSVVVPGHDDLFLVNPYGRAFREITASQLLICDFDGNVLDGDGEPEATAFFIHAEVHRRVPRARVAFHTHMPYATALSMTEGPPLVWAGQTALKFYGRTAVDEDYNGLALDATEGARIAGAVGDADIMASWCWPPPSPRRGMIFTISNARQRCRCWPCPPGGRCCRSIQRSRRRPMTRCARATRSRPGCIWRRCAVSLMPKNRNTGIEHKTPGKAPLSP